MTEVVTFEGRPPEGMINFGLGQPSADLLPLDLMAKASEGFFADAEPHDLNYGILAGDPRFLSSLATFLSKNYAAPVDAGNLFVTGGNSQAIDLICSHLSKPGDTIIVEEPCYFLAYQIFKDHDLNIVSVPLDKDGLDITALESILATTKPKFLYTIPAYQNPSGQTMSLQRRKRLIEISREHDFLILADEVYQLLSFYGDPPAAFGTMIESDSVISFGSFSKIMAPGLRLGWIHTSDKWVKRFSDIGYINCGGNINNYTSHIVRHAMDMGLLQSHLVKMREVYRSRVEAMDFALSKCLSEHANWLKPRGGYFFWIELKKDINARELLKRAREKDVGFNAGDYFSSMGALKNFIRLSFAYYDEDDIKEGVFRIKNLLENPLYP